MWEAIYVSVKIETINAELQIIIRGVIVCNIYIYNFPDCEEECWRNILLVLELFIAYIQCLWKIRRYDGPQKMLSYNVFPLFSALADTDTRYSAREEAKGRKLFC